jgi:ParB family chromosome partitioning protein
MSAARKRGLGRGIEALLSSKGVDPQSTAATATAASSRPADIRTLPVSKLEPNRFQPRTHFDETDLAELAESIKAQGVIQPIVVALRDDGQYTIIAGERRWRASKLAGLNEVPVVVREVGTDQELLELALVENLQRADLNPIEEAEAYKSLRETFGLSQEEVAKRVGKSRSAVTNSLRLLRLPSEILDMLRDGTLAPGLARPLLSLRSPVEQLRMARRVIDERLSARQIEQLVGGDNETAGSSSKKAAKKGGPEVHTAAAAEKLTQALQTKVEIKRRGERGYVQIHFHSEEELMRIYDLLVEGAG